MEVSRESINNIIEKIRELYPNMSNDEAEKYIKSSLNDKTVIEIIVNYVCYCKHTKNKES